MWIVVLLPSVNQLERKKNALFLELSKKCNLKPHVSCVYVHFHYFSIEEKQNFSLIAICNRKPIIFGWQRNADEGIIVNMVTVCCL